MVGRWAVWPAMFAIFLALVTRQLGADALLYVGLAMTLAATALYVQDGVRAIAQSLNLNLRTALYSPRTLPLERTGIGHVP